MRVVILVALSTLVSVRGSPAQSLPRQIALPVPLYASDSAWNQRAAGVAVLPESDQQILVLYRVLRGDTSSLHPSGQGRGTDWPYAGVNWDDYTIPVFGAGKGQQSVLLRNYDGGAGGCPKLSVAPDGTVNVPAPEGQVRPAGPQSRDADGHLVLYEPGTSTEYDFWQATTARDGSGGSLGGGQVGDKILEAGAVDSFDVHGTGANAPTLWSARATGPPLLAGLILPEDIERGAIDHALAFAIPGPRNTGGSSEPSPSDYFYPASTTEVEFYNTNPDALASGQRIRLKETLVDDGGNSVAEDELAPITRMFLAALRNYGAYLVDNAGGFAFYAEDVHTAVLNLTEDEVNRLVGRAPGTPMPEGASKWQLAMEKLNQDLERIPVAFGPWSEGQDPSTATITASNFEVVEPATPPPGR